MSQIPAKETLAGARGTTQQGNNRLPQTPAWSGGLNPVMEQLNLKCRSQFR
jgi:hypothetical protein